MNGFRSEDDSVTCSCTFGKPCETHALRERESREQWERQCAAEGIDPNASVVGLEDVVLAIDLSPALSENQKKAMRRIMFPRK